jgi:Secretion system C-terminal sorting domain
VIPGLSTTLNNGGGIRVGGAGNIFPAGGDDFVGVSADGARNVYIIGDFNGAEIDLGSDTLLKENGAENMFIASFNYPLPCNPPAVVCEPGLVNQAPSLYPNPTHEVLHVSQQAGDPKNFSILDYIGRTIYTGMLASGVTDIDVSGCPQGLYLLKTLYGQSIPFLHL